MVSKTRGQWSFENAGRSVRGLGALLIFLSCAACGRPATEPECREILRKAALLELQPRLNESEELIQQELTAIEESMQGAMMEKCVGKRISEKTLHCVREAQTTQVLFEECF